MREERGTMRPIRAAGVIALAWACGPSATQSYSQGQVVLYLDTDAPVPPIPPDISSAPAPLFDRLRVEVFPPDASSPCDGCTNEFEVDAAHFADDRLSFGVVPPAGAAGYRARVRLFYGAFATAAGDPDDATTIDVTVSLPVVGERGVLEATVVLHTDDVGRPVGSLVDPVAPAPGRPTSTLVGTWPGARRVPCAGEPREGEVCVPGGAYWMGNPLAANPEEADPYEGTRPRLVSLAPFFIGATEVTVADLRRVEPTAQGTWSGQRNGSSFTDFCKLTTTPGPFDAYPVNCVTWEEARTYCTTIGGDLPTEAQYEYVASGLTGKVYPWGTDDPACRDAVYARGGNGVFSGVARPCAVNTIGGHALPGEGALDVVTLPTGKIVDLAGNLREWMLDAWNRQTEPCWNARGVYANPRCMQASASDGPGQSMRGGDWLTQPAALRAAARGWESTLHTALASGPTYGFRCVRDASPR
jgi:formylglycine-generating enzyme required for sulfatase activity